jgi:hypothetical protein
MGNKPIISPLAGGVLALGAAVPIAAPPIAVPPGAPPAAPAPPAPAGGAPAPGAPAPAAPGTAITLSLNAPVTNQSAAAVVTVTPAPAVGTVLTFALQVIDDIGGISQPATFPVTVRGLPTATLTGPGAVPVGSTIPLTGVGTASGGGKIVSFTWTLKSATPGVG